ncbi:MAG TPA: hypothetical protein VGO90_01560 [Chthoniobacteraceae bacterium]|jgi:hypothetical protein|nr:hypothetical protein [Chthoniobacteraceae bacterium]
MAKPNYQFEKRKRDMEKKAKKEDKRLRKLNPTSTPDSENADQTAPAAETK